jgi:hypothetical protein
MQDPAATLADLDARELRALAELRAVAAERTRVLAQVLPLIPVQAPAPPKLLEAEALVERWRAAGLETCPSTGEALLHKMRRARKQGPGNRWHALLALGEKHRAGRTLRWPWAEAERLIGGETG